MTALYNLLVASLITNFTGNTHTTATVDNLSSVAGLFIGLPVFGAGIPSGAVIATIGVSSLTLTQPATASATGVSFTTGFLTTGRRLLRWDLVAAQPAMFLRDGPNEYPSHSAMVYPKPQLEPEIWIYSKAGENPDLAPSIALNNIIDAIENSLEPKTGPDVALQQLSLGGLIQHCWIEGRIEIDPGDLDSQAKAIVPLKILVPTTPGP